MGIERKVFDIDGTSVSYTNSAKRDQLKSILSDLVTCYSGIFQTSLDINFKNITNEEVLQYFDTALNVLNTNKFELEETDESTTQIDHNIRTLTDLKSRFTKKR